MMKNNIAKYAALLFTSLLLCACSDFFNVDTDDVLDEEKYINEESEMYAGFLGIITKLQAVADKGIYILEPRAELVEPTTNAPSELYALYNYEENLAGNFYADPAPYYDMIIACNDYLLKMEEYKKNTPVQSINMTHYNGLISSTLRQKVWVYLNMAKIYGEAIWFDEPLREYTDLSKYPLLDLDEIVDKCLTLMDNGYNGIPSNLSMAWESYIDPDASGSTGDYFFWEAQTPPDYMLYSELYLWKASKAVGQAQIDYYQRALDLLQAAFHEELITYTTNPNSITSRNRVRNQDWRGKLSNIWGGKTPYRVEAVSLVLYNYAQQQTNGLKKHFETTYPNQYMLAPTNVGMERYSAENQDLGESANDIDIRVDKTFGGRNSSTPYIRKFTGGSNDGQAYQDDNFVLTYRSAEMYFMLVEALNGVGRYEEAGVIMNKGIAYYFPYGGVTWDGFSDWWTPAIPSGVAVNYPTYGIRYSLLLGDREMSDNVYDEEGNLVEAADPRFNDEAMLDEMMLDMPCEGKTYPAMIRIARKYNNDFSILADRICPKYANPESIRAKIEAGGYFIKWDYGF